MRWHSVRLFFDDQFEEKRAMRKLCTAVLLLVFARFASDVLASVDWSIFDHATPHTSAGSSTSFGDNNYHTAVQQFHADNDYTFSHFKADNGHANGLDGTIQLKVYQLTGYHGSLGSATLLATSVETIGPSFFPAQFSFSSPVSFTSGHYYAFVFAPVTATTGGIWWWNNSNISGTSEMLFYRDNGTYYTYGWGAGAFSLGNLAATPLSFPLDGSLEERTISLEFGEEWPFGECPTGVYKKHTGIDLDATAEEDVFATHDGTVKAIYTGQHAQWADAIIIEDDSDQFTTVYWHVIKHGNLSVNDHVTKGQQIATVADLGGNTHFHFGIRLSDYHSSFSLAGALPEENCGTNPTYPAFPEDFLDPAQITYE